MSLFLLIIIVIVLVITVVDVIFVATINNYCYYCCCYSYYYQKCNQWHVTKNATSTLKCHFTLLCHESIPPLLFKIYYILYSRIFLFFSFTS